MDQLMIILLLLIVGIVVFCCRDQIYEYFPGSQGYYLITWDRPPNTVEQDLKYHLEIVDDSTKKIVAQEKALSGTSYQFSDGKWKTKYIVEVSAINEAGEGPSASVDFTSGVGSFDTSQIKGVQIWGNQIMSELQLGDEFKAFTVACDIPKDVDRLVKSSAKDITTHITVEYTSTTGGTCTWELTKDPAGKDGVELIVGTGRDYIPKKLFSGPFALQTDAKCASFPDWKPSSITGKACGCPMKILTNDQMKITYTFIQEEDGATSTTSHTIKWDPVLPTYPQKLKAVWQLS